MDDSQQTSQNNTDDDQTQQGANQQNDYGAQPVRSQQPQPSEKQEEVSEEQPVSAPSKEGGPGAPMPEKLMAPSVPEMEVSADLHKETGAEAVSDIPKLTPEDTQAGIVHAKESVPVSVAPTTTITLPMTLQQAQQTVKLHKKVKDSLFWFAMLIMRQWQIAEKHKHKT